MSTSTPEETIELKGHIQRKKGIIIIISDKIKMFTTVGYCEKSDPLITQRGTPD